MRTALNTSACETVLETENFVPQIVLIDYHLDHGQTGINVMRWLRKTLKNPQLPGIIISADARPELPVQAHNEQLGFLTKPVKPAALRALMNKYCES